MAEKKILDSPLHTRYAIGYTRRASRGVTLMDTVVGTALMLVIFLGIWAAFQLSIDVVTNNKARGSAIALGNERMEYIRSITYASIGTSGGIPSGSIAQSESTTLNGVTFTRRTVIEYADDPKDGTGGADTNGITSDYKVAKVDVSWTSRTGVRHIILVSRFEPPAGMEIACTPPCGTLTVDVVNANSQLLSGASVSIVNSSTVPTISINTFTNASGTASFIGAPAASGYQIVTTKSGYSTAQTYSVTAQNTNPDPGHLTVSNNQTTTGTFAIDVLSSLAVSTYSRSTNTWSDSFSDESKIGASTDNIEVSGNRARFEGIQPWTAPANLYSQTITPIALSRWGTFSWNDTQPSETTITYHVYYPSGGGLTLVPDSVLSGNSTGFSSSTSLDVSGIPADTYPSLVLHAYLVAQNPNAPSPSIEEWSLTYESGQGIAIPFTMRGAKVIGSGPSGTVYKYDQLLTTNSSGALTISNLEWDAYTLSVAASTGYDIASSCAPQPIVIAPNTSRSVQLFLAAQTANSLLVDVKNNSGTTISGGSVRLTKGGSYDATVTTDACGQAFFGGLTNGNYSVSASSTGYQTYSADGIDVTGTTRFSIVLN
ncbi:carboxypeptidase regulatory-like domain-containing protein [Candidatus Kaiserbacteria bacterium]|nr:carboxypeptidase regulatory-like domain-containing protein [Candidatus Kaiserbacteria bacterium]